MNIILDDLNSEQKSAVLLLNQPLLVIAGAGSGKTRVITKKIAYLIASGVVPNNIIALTFTNKAANEMKERALQISPYAEDVWIGTFHSLCIRILRKEIKLLGYKSNFSITDSSDSLEMIKNSLKILNLGKEYIPKNIAAKISFAKSRLITPSNFLCSEFIIDNYDNFRSQKILEVYNRYQSLLKQSNSIDFDDIICLTVELFKKYDEVLDKYRTCFKYILVDEYQDTNPAQYSLIRLLTGQSQNICVVGDDDQSIYSWRGADIKNILDFEKDFDNAKIIKLEQNYRSTQIILDAANAVIKNNTQRKNKILWTQDKSSNKITIYIGETVYDETKFISSQIRSKRFAFGEIAILYRNNFQSRAIEDSLIEFDIPYKLIGGTRFYDRMEIKDLISYLRIIDNSDNELAFSRAISVPKRGVGEKTLMNLADIALQHKVSRLQTINLGFVNKNNLVEFANVIAELVSYSKTHSLYSLLEEIIRKINYKEYIKRFDNYSTRLENIEELLAKIHEFEMNENNKNKLTDFLEQITLLSEVDNSDQNSNAVSLMTLHGAKGLEFPCVFIFGANNDIIPGLHKSKSEIEEERRLFYVGVTRAKKNLYITASKLVFSRSNNEMISSEPSAFINEIPEHLIKYDSECKVNKKNTAFNVNNFDLDNDFSFCTDQTKIKYSKSTMYRKLNSDRFTYTKNNVSSNNTLNFVVGDKVNHKIYGSCIVKNIELSNNQQYITLLLVDGTEKVFASRYLQPKLM